MTAPMPPIPPEDLPRPPGDDRPFPEKAYVGGMLRPGRPVTIGRRRSDRVMAYMTVGLMIFMMLFILYTSWEQNRATAELEKSEQERSLILSRVECLSANTGEFEEAVAEYLIAQSLARSDNDPRVAAALDHLRVLQAQRQPNFPPDRCTSPSAPATTTTTR